MNLLLIDIDLKIRDTLINYLIPRGYPVFDCSFNDSIDEILTIKEINAVFMDIDKEGGLINHLDLIRKIRSKNINVITYSKIVEKSEIKVLVENGISGFVEKTDKLTIDLKKLIEILFKRCYPNEKRQALRIKIEKEDEVKIKFSVPNSNKTVDGDVIDISFAGLLFKLDQYSDTRGLKKGDYINKINLSIGSKRAITDAQIVMTKGDYVGVKFTEHDDALRGLLVKYIYDKMSAI